MPIAIICPECERSFLVRDHEDVRFINESSIVCSVCNAVLKITIASDNRNETKIPQYDITLDRKRFPYEEELIILLCLSGKDREMDLRFDLSARPNDKLYPCYRDTTLGVRSIVTRPITGKERYLPEIFQQCVRTWKEGGLKTFLSSLNPKIRYGIPVELFLEELPALL